MLKIITEKHYQPAKLDSVFSVKTFHKLMYVLDPDKIYFTKEDSLELLESNLFEVDNLRSEECSHLDIVQQLYHRRLNEAFQRFDTISFSSLAKARSLGDARGYAPQADQHTDQAINYLARALYSREIYSYQETNAAQSRETLFSRMLQVEKCKIENLLNELSIEGLRSKILKAIASSFDPHSRYLTFHELAQINQALSKKDFSFGIEIKEVNGEVRINKVIPGSSAWRSNQIHEGDRIVEIANIYGSPLPISCSAYRDISKILLSNEHKGINILVEKNDGQHRRVRLLKEIVNVEDNIINSYLLKGTKTIGYISLPAFYNDSESDNANGCARDVALEIMKLKKHNIEGLIFDLRFNGGGLLKEAVELTGIFIDEGPVCVVESNEKKPTLVKDPNRGVMYDGPLVVLVNNFSASASEVFSAALQDYNRAIIVGDHTFGKSTGQGLFQVILPKTWATISDTPVQPNVVNLTTLKLYRVDGSTYQKNGVEPDVFLPDIYGKRIKLEKDYENAIDARGTSKNIYYKKLKELPIDSLKKRSEQRIQENEAFINAVRLNETLSTSFEEALNRELLLDRYRLFIESSSKTAQAFQVENNSFSEKILQISETQKLIMDEYTAKIRSDIYVEEAYFILNDFLDLSY